MIAISRLREHDSNPTGDGQSSEKLQWPALVVVSAERIAAKLRVMSENQMTVDLEFERSSITGGLIV